MSFFIHSGENHWDLISAPFQGSKYLISREVPLEDINDFQDNCKSAGGYLAEIDTQNEYDFIMASLKQVVPTGRSTAYVGATDEENEGSWGFMNSGRPASFLKFHGNYGSRSTSWNCLLLIWHSDDAGFGDWKCENGGNRRYVCERPKAIGELLLHNLNGQWLKISHIDVINPYIFQPMVEYAYDIFTLQKCLLSLMIG